MRGGQVVQSSPTLTTRRRARPRLAALERAVMEALAYADLFDWPLTPSEVHAYLPLAADPAETRAALRTLTARPAAGGAPSVVATDDRLVALTGREHLFASRRRREVSSAGLWARAAGAAAAVASLPLVRMVAVTGSLAAGAAGPDADVDLLLVTNDGRLWLTRAMAMIVTRAASLGGVRLCPNYFLAESALELSERDVFTAHELARMIPLSGLDTHRELLARNAWYRDFLPNHRGVDAAAVPGTPIGRRRLGRLVEPAMRMGVFGPLERWEMRRKIDRLVALTTSDEQRFDATTCKGHFAEHGHAARDAYRERLAMLDAAFETDGGDGADVAAQAGDAA